MKKPKVAFICVHNSCRSQIAEALGKQMYTVTGDFSLMVNWDKFFGSTSAVKEAEKTSQGVEVQKNPSMMTMLIPWITFWIAVSVNTEKGSVIALLVASAISS